MDSVKKKVYLDVFASPGTLLPVAGGITAMLAAWATNGSPALMFAGIAGMLVGAGVTATRLVFGLHRITQDAYDHVVERQRMQQEESLERLNERLVNDQDSRTQNCLRNLRHLYSQLQEKVAKNSINSAAFGVIEGVDRMFRTCVEQLEHSVDLWDNAQTLSGSARQSLLQQREDLVLEICATVDHLGQTVNRFHAMTTNKNRNDLARLRKELDESMRVAREVERRTEELLEHQSHEHLEHE